MKYVPIRSNKHIFTLFTLFGFVLSLITLQLAENWIRFLAVLYQKPDLGYHELPSVLHYIEWTFPWIMWAVLVVIFTYDARKRNFVRTSGYITGLIVATIVSFIIFVVSYGNTMADF